MARYRLIPRDVEAIQLESGIWEIHDHGRIFFMIDKEFKQFYHPVFYAESCDDLGHIWTWIPGDMHACFRCGIEEPKPWNHILIYRPPNEAEIAKNPALQAKYELAKKICEETQTIDMTSEEYIDTEDLHDLNNEIDDIQEKN